MPEPDDNDPTIHWIGTGLSTGSGLAHLSGRYGRVVLWGRSVDKAAACARRLRVGDAVEPRAFDLPDLGRQLSPGDVVISMLPAPEHAAILRECITRGAHFACSSYTSADIAALAEAARARGLVVLTEAGLDPGIDHLLAHMLLARARASLGDTAATVALRSYCGGLPAVANDFRYRFSWAPRGVLTALLTPARYVEGGKEHTAEHPWEAVRTQVLDGEEFEVYPNRDSIPFIGQYGIPPQWEVREFVRGTLRLSGWKDAWADVFASLRADGPAGVDALAARLAARYPMTDSDRDRVVLTVDLEVRTSDGRVWSGRQTLDLVGTEAENAMALCVSMPVAVGVTRILQKALPAGLHRAAETAAEAQHWLDELGRLGISVSADEPSDGPTSEPITRE